MPRTIHRQPHLQLSTLAAFVSTAFALPLAAQTVTPPAQPAVCIQPPPGAEPDCGTWRRGVRAGPSA